ncbi:hypothetical protein N431DRAFT_484272 [Stipitochalara longipes BDJ]|nr:hypothetical protein N431DRAFT_484272 [Stipitochalara longipes BDJ]
MDDGEMLKVGGRLLDVVARIVDMKGFTTDPQPMVERVHQVARFFERSERQMKQDMSLYALEAIWRTLVANRCVRYGYPCSYDYTPVYCQLVSASLPRKVKSGNVDNELLKLFLGDVSNAITARKDGPYRCFVVTERGRFGLGPPGCSIGDQLCILKNFSTPAILRDRGSYHTFIGTAYVHGVMYGEEYGHYGKAPEQFCLR